MAIAKVGRAVFMATEDSGGSEEAVETARYIGSMAKELRALAAKANLNFLAYLLAMVEDDAHALIRKLTEGS